MLFSVEGIPFLHKVVYLCVLSLFSSLGVAHGVLASPMDHLPDPLSLHTILRMLSSLVLIICLLLILRYFLTKRPQFSLLKTPYMRIISSLSLSIKDRIVVLEIADSWVIIGITAEKMNTLYTMPKPDHPPHTPDQTTPLQSALSFPQWLKSMVDRKK